MADSKITALTAITTVNPATYPLVIVDTSDTSMAGSGTTKKVTTNQLLGSGGTATLASATITGDLTVDTSTLKVDSANNRVGIGTASPSYILDILGASPRLHIRDNGTGSSLLDIENGAGTFYVGRENSTGSGGLSGVPYAGILYLQGAYPIICGTNFTERYRIASDGVATWSNVGGVAGTAMTLNSTGLGVGDAPTADCKLTVRGGAFINRGATGGASQLLVSLAASSGGNFGQISNTGTRWALGYGSTLTTVGTEALIWDSSGNVGIGVAPSAWVLGKVLEVGQLGNALWSPGAGDFRVMNNSFYGSGPAYKYAANGFATMYQTQNGQHQFHTAPSGTAGNPITFTERLRLKETGQLRFVPLASDPAGAEAGDVYYNSTSNKLKCYNGTTWNDLF